MHCPICHHGSTRDAEITVTLDRPGPNPVTVVFRAVPAKVCENCGEEFLDEAVAAELLKRAAAAKPSGDTVLVQRYAAA
jgi:YgiT-type zinc finger domain-containing protein